MNFICGIQTDWGIGREVAFSLAEAGVKAVVFAGVNAKTAKQSS